MKIGCAGVLACGLILVLLLASMAGCVQGNDGPDGPVSVGYTVGLYFINSEYAETGDTALERYVVESRDIEINSAENHWLAILEELKTVNDENASSAISEDVEFEHAYVSEEDETLMIVDLRSTVSGGGSMQEVFFISQIVETIIGNGHLFEDSKNVNKVQFLVKGETVESLMGHISASEPFTSELN